MQGTALESLEQSEHLDLTVHNPWEVCWVPPQPPLGSQSCLSIHTLGKALSYSLKNGWESLDQASVTSNLTVTKCVSW